MQSPPFFHFLLLLAFFAFFASFTPPFTRIYRFSTSITHYKPLIERSFTYKSRGLTEAIPSTSRYPRPTCKKKLATREKKIFQTVLHFSFTFTRLELDNPSILTLLASRTVKILSFIPIDQSVAHRLKGVMACLSIYILLQYHEWHLPIGHGR